MARRKNTDIEENLREMDAAKERLERAEIKFQPFSFTLEGQLAVEKNSDKITLLHRLHYFNGVVEVTDNGTTELPADLFKDTHTLEQFAALTNQAFTAFLPAALNYEAILHLNDVVHFMLHKLQLETVDLRDQAKVHARETQKLVLKRFGVQNAGRAPQWQKIELTRALRDALRMLPKKKQTYVNVANILKKKYGDKAPKSGESLRKMIDHLGMDWKRLKNGGF